MVEVTRTLRETFGLSDRKAMHRESEIRQHFPEAWIEDYEDLIPAMTNHPKDRHRRCYQAAGLDERWRALVTEIRREHHRKSGFMPGFEAIVAGKRARVETSFLDRARRQWARKAKH
jgi:transposase